MFLTMSSGDRLCLPGNSEAFRLHPYRVFRWVTPVWSLMDGRPTWSFMAEVSESRDSLTLPYSSLSVPVRPVWRHSLMILNSGHDRSVLLHLSFGGLIASQVLRGWPCLSPHKSTSPSQNGQPENRGVRYKLGQWFMNGQGGLPLINALLKYTHLIHTIHSP